MHMMGGFLKQGGRNGRNRHHRWASVAALLLLCLAICQFPAPLFAADVVDRIVAVVNDDIIRLRQLEEAVAPIAEQIRSESLSDEKAIEQIYDARQQILNEMINETLADQQAAEAGIQVPDQAVDAAVERVKSLNYYTDEDLRNALQMRGMTMEEYRREIEKQILRSRLVNLKVKSKIVVTADDIRRYYESHPKEYGGSAKYQLRNILMDYPEYDDAEKKAHIRTRMQDVLDRLRAGESFTELARTYSEGPNAVAGGELGKFSIDDLSTQLRPVIRDLKAGEYSEIVETDRGFQIFYVEEIIQTPAEPLEQVAEEIENRLYEQMVNEKYKQWIESLRADAHIRIIR